MGARTADVLYGMEEDEERRETEPDNGVLPIPPTLSLDSVEPRGRERGTDVATGLQHLASGLVPKGLKLPCRCRQRLTSAV